MLGTFNVAGAMMRTGTTTLAIQLVRALEANGYNAAYVEMNPQNYIWATCEVYSGASKSDMGHLTYDDVDMFASRYYKDLTSGNGEYDYLICDYGSMIPPSFNISAFNNCDACIITAGVKPNEYQQTESVLRRERLGELTLPIYAFYQVPDYDQLDVIDNMPEMSGRVFFIPEIPDPFARMPSAYSRIGIVNEGGSDPGFFFNLLNAATMVSEEKQRMKRKNNIKRA